MDSAGKPAASISISMRLSDPVASILASVRIEKIYLNCPLLFQAPLIMKKHLLCIVIFTAIVYLAEFKIYINNVSSKNQELIDSLQTLEYGFPGSRQQFIGGLQYRFGL
jgi:hypothetical protein